MGKKKGYNVAEIDLQQEDDVKMEKTESFTVKDYDGNSVQLFPRSAWFWPLLKHCQWRFLVLAFYDLAIANDVVKEQPGKQLNTDLNKEEINSDIPSDVFQPDTQGNFQINLISADYKYTPGSLKHCQW